MRTALFALMGAALLATSPAVSLAQAPVNPRPGAVTRDRDNDRRSRDRDDRWDWERGRDDRRGNGYGWGRDDDWRRYEREQRDFDKRSRRWNRRQWDAFRSCERDLWRRSRWDLRDTRREALYERRRIRDYCERRVSRW